MSFVVNLLFIGFGVGLGWCFWKRGTSTISSDLSATELQVSTSKKMEESSALREITEERDFLNSQFDLLLSKLNDEAKTNWRTSGDGTFGDLEKVEREKLRLAKKIKEFVGKVDKDTRRHVSSLDEESLGVISPIRDQLQSEEKSRLEVQDSFNRLVGKLEPQLQNTWEGLDEGSVGRSDLEEENRWRSRFEHLLSKVDPQFHEWQRLERASLTLLGDLQGDEEILSTQDWLRSDLAGDGPTWLLESPGREPDDLKRIWGVGPVLEKTLNSLGIYYFSQLSQLTEVDDIAWVSERIKTFPDRIERDQWVKQAGLLLDDPDAIMKKPY